MTQLMLLAEPNTARTRSSKREVSPHRMSARLSKCALYRYTLERTWDAERPSVMFIGLNPSTADATHDDPTVRRCVGFAKRWGFGSMLLTNLFALRATDPRALMDVEDPIGPSNDRWIDRTKDRASLVVAAWGARGGLMDRDSEVAERFSELHCLGTTKDGSPRHPLYLRADAEPRSFR